MNYSLVKNFFEDNKYDELLESYVPKFEVVDKYAQMLQSGVVDNPAECIKALNELTGVYMDIKKIVEIIGAIKLNKELKFYVDRKKEYEDGDILDANDKPAKFVSAAVERESSLHVADYRRIRNIFSAYLDSSTQGIQSIQSILKSLTFEYNIDPK